MRELMVYYCPKCGYYAYYQLSKNAVCPKCNTNMTRFHMRYQDFMHLNYEERDELLSKEILNLSDSIISRLSLSSQKANSRETIATLRLKLEDLSAENQKLNETVDWMHQTIWELLRKNKKLEHRLEELGYPMDDN